MKTARIIATLTILGALAFYFLGIPALLLPDDFLKEDVSLGTSIMITLWMTGYLYMAIQGAYFLLKHIWGNKRI